METKRLSLGRRLEKYWIHYLIVMPPMLWLLFAKLIPFIQDVRLAFVDFKPFIGLWNSEWVGLDHFRALFANPAFRQVLANTVSIKLGYLILCGVVSLLLALALSAIASRRLRGFFQTLFLLPYFVPTLIFAYVAAAILSPSQQALFPVHTLILGEAGSFRPIIMLLETIKTCGIPILLAMAAIEYRQAARARQGLSGPLTWSGRIGPAARGIAAYLILQFATLLSVDFEMLYYLASPLVHETGDTLDAFQVRSGFMMMNTGLASASWLLQFAVQLVLAFAAYAIVRGFFARDLFGERREIAEDGNAEPATASVVGGRVGTEAGAVGENDRAGSEASTALGSGRAGTAAGTFGGSGSAGSAAGSALGVIFATLYAIVVLSLLYVLFIQPFVSGGASSSIRLGDVLPGGNYAIYLILYAVMVGFGMVMTLLLAYPLTVRDLPGRGLYKAVLIALIGMGNLSFSQYLFARELGMVNTVFSQIWAGCFTIAGVFVLKSYFNSRYGASKEQRSAAGQSEAELLFALFIPKVWKPLLAIGILQFSALWGSFYASLIYLNNPEHYTPLMRFMQLATGSQSPDMTPGDPVIMQLAALIALPPIVLLLVFRKLLTADTLLSQVRKG